MRLRSPFVLWFTGLPCSGKSTLASALVERLLPINVEYLDGDRVRSSLPPIGFSAEERNRHIRQIAFWSSRFEAHGIPVVAAFVSPYRQLREEARASCAHFIEVYVSTSLEVCMARDVKGMYAKALAGEIEGFTGVGDPYEPPRAPELVLDTATRSIEDCLVDLLGYLRTRELIA